MKRSNTSARNAVSGSTEFPWNWKLKDLEARPKNGHTVFSCFSCGGGSSMGYKLAGYSVVGNCEIDADMMKIYRKNNHPEHSFLMDIRDFVKLPDEEIPEELKHLDILDGSPPCSVFSMAGSREDGWNVEKTFREGQAKQRLDDLFFYFIKVAEKLKPKVVIAENVKGLINGNAKGWVNQIVRAFDEAGYARSMILIVNAWLGYPYMMILCMGLLKAIPDDLYEASAMDGAGPLQNFFKITVRLLLKPLTPLLIASFAFNFNNFVLIMLLTNGGPDLPPENGVVTTAGSTDLLVSYTYRLAFEGGAGGNDYGLASAIATTIFILVGALSVGNLKLSKMAAKD